MAKFLSVTLCLATVIAIVASQSFDYFGGFSSFAASPRDPRANRGSTSPVTFPVTSIGRETSGVRVGASGYGFVPPGTRGGIGPHGAGPNYFSGLQYW